MIRARALSNVPSLWKLPRQPASISQWHYAHRSYQSNTPLKDTFPPLAFAFDIDGVLLRGSQAIPAAKRALAILEGANPTGSKIPYILLTNGGGTSEEARCKKLTSILGFEIDKTHIIQSHTVLKQIVEKYANLPVLVLGGRNDEVRKVAEGYGFSKAYTTLDVLAWNPAVWPFHDLTELERQSTKEVDFTQTPIAAAFVFHDPRNWALDIQILCDVFQSGGIIGGPHGGPGGTVGRDSTTQASQHRRPELIFCNPDLLWKANFERPRLGQGGFRIAFQAVYKAVSGAEYPYVQFGKPTEATYQFTKQVLHDRFNELYGQLADRPPRVYMVGDNPESDIAGANAAGWSSVLVHTGVYDPQQGPPSHTPTHQASDVEEAVKWAIERELAKGH
ncbi:HAD-like domain-containing protein [Fomitopsis serialis]|uniref:HAD-like domain-containing protein n=1 Tax=Fomitopsis serialis TaxID=139415 RepID=UPI0020084DFB|nr:HAD-like domain-containing protein [Neoantrodia serialis]KAH9935561.1 HAD-like domain-containing protein [Neoantrodia serialis]